MTNTEPFVSVIMPAYNAEKYIAEAIDSILNQTYKNFELIILDDASTDNTWKIIEDYASKDKRIISIRNEKNLYIAGNRNKGISIAKGTYIVWQDADDVSYPTRIKKLVQFMEDSVRVGICGSYIQSFNERGDLDVRRYATDDRTLRAHIFMFSPVAQPAAIIRSDIFSKVGEFDESYPPAEDIDMSFRIGEFYDFANLPEILLKYREHPDSATHTKLKKQLESTLKVRKLYMKNSKYHFRAIDYCAFVLTFIVKYASYSLTIALFKVARYLIYKFNL